MNDHILLWTDIETTGLDPKHDDILEIGLVATTMRGEEIVRYVNIVRHDDGIHVTVTNTRAIEMHLRNHLIVDVLTSSIDGHRPEDIADEIDDFIQTLLDHHQFIHPAGTNIDFDLTFIRECLHPDRLDDLSYRRLDMTALRLLDMAVGVDPYAEGHGTTHRVRDCLARDIEEWRRRVGGKEGRR